MIPDPYAWLKALHVAAAITFAGGILSVAVFLAAAGPGCTEAARALHRWDRRATTPAMLLVWALGLTLALMGGWLREGWMVAKLALVVALSGAHGVQSAKLRRLAGGVPAGASPGLAAPLIVGFVVAIAVLVVVKPF